MHRFYLPPDHCKEPVMRLEGREAHHAVDVLRLRTSEKVSVLDGAGNEYQCEVLRMDRRGVDLSVLNKKTSPPLPCHLTLLQAIPKGKMFDFIVEKATELGAARVVPILSERVVVHLKEGEPAAKIQKWRQTAAESIKQCGSPWMPQIDAPQTPAEFLARGESFELPLIASLLDERSHPRKYFQRFREQHGRNPTSACIWIGPEGDFTPQEVRAIIAASALPISLGNLVLRCETAAVCALSILSYELQFPNT